ncbi:lysine N-methyltransferase setd3 (Partial), partial [Seminavis robusta]|eukprot:Sro536_g162040.1 lysine N-methyltransferase setd3 (323) ;mRNA; r:2-971
MMIMLLRTTLVATLALGSQAFTSYHHHGVTLTHLGASASSSVSIEAVGQDLNTALEGCQDEVAKTVNVAVGSSPTTGRLGLIATKNIKKGEVCLAMPLDDRYMLTADVARDVVFMGVLPEKFEGWTGDAGLIALLILNELARTAEKGIQLPTRGDEVQALMKAWVSALPSPEEMKQSHPLLWSEEDQEILQLSSTNKIYRVLDDIEEDVAWLSERVFTDEKLPETVVINGEERPCFSQDGFRWAVALAQSRAVFVDSALRLLPLMDMCNHDDEGEEITRGMMGPFKMTKGAQIIAAQSYKAGDEIFCSYGPKSAADYLLEHGF